MIDPKISVLMPVYNSEKYLAEAIDSILNQTLKDFELLIINDGSTDFSLEIAKSYAEKDLRVSILKNTRSKGVAGALNTGLQVARGKYIARMDADDISFPERFQKQFDFMEKNPDIDVCGSWYELFGFNGGVIKTPSSHKEIKETLVFYCCIGHPSVMIRGSSLYVCDLEYSEKYPNAEDYEFWCRVTDRFKFANIPEILLKYRVHENQTGFAKKKEQDNTADKVRIRNLNKIGVSLTNTEQSIYLNIIKYRYDFNSTTDMISACEIMEKIRIAGLKYGYGSKFRQIISEHLSNISQTGIRSGRTSLKLFFGIFLKNGVFTTNRAKIRYFYHSMRNIFNV
jgi:glycosyltransferase involved in cell wall biosynthesis